MSRRWLTILAAITAAFSAPRAFGEVYGNFECVGVVADLPSGHTVAQIGEVRVYIDDGGAWKRVQNAVRVGFENFYASSVFNLEPGTNYNFRVEFYNTTASLIDTQYMGGSTRAEPAIPATANNLFVSTSGSDSGAGTIGDPFATVAHAFSVATAGTTIHLRGGTYYQGEVYPPRDGTAANPIVLRAYGGENVILDGAEPSLISTSWTTVQPQVYRRSYTGDPRNVTLKRKSNGEVFRAFMMATADEVITRTSEGYSFDTLLIDAAYCADGANLTIRVPSGQISDYDVYVSARNTGIYLENRDFIYIDGITFTHYGHGDYSRGIYVYSSSDILVQNCKFLYNNVGVWVKNNSHRVTVQDNLCVDDTADWHFGYTKSAGVHYHSEVETGLVTCGGTYSGRGLVVRRNVIRGLFDGSGLAPFAGYTGARTAETEFYDNDVQHIADDFIEIDGYARNFRVFRNYMRVSLSGISLAQALDGPTWLVRNVIADCGLVPATTVEGYESYPFKTNGGPHPEIGSGEVFFYHNTAYTLDPASRAVLIKHATWRRFTFRNNIWCGKWRGFDSWE
ncbi:MAG: right-handed parallel beta-helix repeat-containing protein, partial [Planctomycetota bacterium]